MRYDVTAIGELLIDFSLERVQEDGYPVLAAHPGGAPANYLAPLAKYGKKTALLAKVGDDAFGRLLRSGAEALGIDVCGVRVTTDAFTTLAFVTRDAAGEREFSFARKPGADMLLCPEEPNMEALTTTRIFHFGTVGMTDEPSRSAHYEAIRQAKRNGAWISLDPNLREALWHDMAEARRQILWSCAQADLIKVSDAELFFLFGDGLRDGALRLMEQYGAKLVFVTLGKDGCYYLNRNAEGRVPSLHDIQVVDTTGAGDIFGGSAAYAILQSGKALDALNDAELQQICSFACTAAALSTTKTGGICAVPELEDVKLVLRRQQNKQQQR